MFIEEFRKVGFFGEGKEERRAAYKREREEVKKAKALECLKEQEEE